MLKRLSGRNWSVNCEMAGLIAATVSDNMSTIMANIISKLNERVVALERRVSALEVSKNDNASTTLPGITVADLIEEGSEQASHVRVGETDVSTNICSARINPLTSQRLSVHHSRSDPKPDLQSGDTENKWTDVIKRRQRSVPQNLLRGRAAPGNTKLEASERFRSYHLYYVKIGTTDVLTG
jgi:hypothetical protein